MQKQFWRNPALFISVLAALMLTACTPVSEQTVPSSGGPAASQTEIVSSQTMDQTSAAAAEDVVTSVETEQTGGSTGHTTAPSHKAPAAQDEKTAAATDKAIAEKTTTRTTAQTGREPVGTATATRQSTTTAALSVSPAEYRQEVLRLVNIEREKAGRQPLNPDENLNQAAQMRAKEIVSAFSHTRPDGRDCFTAMKEAGVSYRAAGENIAKGQRTPEQVVDGWMKSDGHRENLLSADFGRLGVGYHVENGRTYWVQLFAD